MRIFTFFTRAYRSVSRTNISNNLLSKNSSNNSHAEKSWYLEKSGWGNNVVMGSKSPSTQVLIIHLFFFFDWTSARFSKIKSCLILFLSILVEAKGISPFVSRKILGTVLLSDLPTVVMSEGRVVDGKSRISWSSLLWSDEGTVDSLDPVAGKVLMTLMFDSFVSSLAISCLPERLSSRPTSSSPAESSSVSTEGSGEAINRSTLRFYEIKLYDFWF